MAEPALTINTATRERIIFAIDDVEYHVKAQDELSREVEGNFRILLQRDGKLSDRLGKLKIDKDRDQIRRIVEATRKVRIDLVTMVTDVPEDVCENLTSTELAQIFLLYGNATVGQQQEDEGESADDIMDELVDGPESYDHDDV